MKTEKFLFVFLIISIFVGNVFSKENTQTGKETVLSLEDCIVLARENNISIKVQQNTLEDLKLGMKLQGTVRNVTPFGAFIDIGLHDDGLVHISKMSKQFIKDPTDIVNVGDIVDCYVIDINKDKEKVSLSLIEE